ncbi:hypothetical protein PoB_003432100 [Plakobranchus ocellatus]|uniref:Uncharacterized protein n=1 Tax=Plakobranchus ocellatus TaxID=259542 RepID=A0AAV4AML8_9GAST|nr:hypothetical protein PoB_003432100 [Plakobranchus ocellatus]
MAKDTPQIVPTCPGPGTGWDKAYTVDKQPTSVARTAKLNRTAVNLFFYKLQYVLNQHCFKASHIYKADEKKSVNCAENSLVLAAKGKRQVYLKELPLTKQPDKEDSNAAKATQRQLIFGVSHATQETVPQESDSVNADNGTETNIKKKIWAGNKALYRAKQAISKFKPSVLQELVRFMVKKSKSCTELNHTDAQIKLDVLNKHMGTPIDGRDSLSELSLCSEVSLDCLQRVCRNCGLSQVEGLILNQFSETDLRRIITVHST